MVFSVVKAPIEMTQEEASQFKIFLAGSIDMGNAIDWQTRVEEELKTTTSSVTLLNPRRDDGDSSWKQDITFPPFKEQVSWELSHLEKADLILLYLDPSGPAPISLLELGLFGRGSGSGNGSTNSNSNSHSKMIVCCPEGYWRKGNVDIVCERYNIETVSNLDELILKCHTYVPT